MKGTAPATGWPVRLEVSSSRAARRPGSASSSSRSVRVPCRDGGGEAAFAALVSRHGPMVLRASTVRSWAMAMTPRTPSRPSSSFWPPGPGRSGNPSGWATGCTASRYARPAGPEGRGWLPGVGVRTDEQGASRDLRRPAACVPGRIRHRRRRPRSGHVAKVGRLPGSVPTPDRALLLRGPHARRGGVPAELAEWDAPQPAGPGATACDANSLIRSFRADQSRR